VRAASQLALSGRRPWGLDHLPGYRAAVAGFLLFVLLLFGGASTPDEYAQVPVRLAALACIAASLWPLEFAGLRQHRGLIAFALACLALPAIQLIPLPPEQWAGLPGHAVYAKIAGATGTLSWRPLSLTPDLTFNALGALLAPAAMLLAALYLGARDRNTIAGIMAAAAVVSALLALAQLASPDDVLRLYRHTSENAPVGLFANRNHEAAFLACALPLGAAVIPRRPRRIRLEPMLALLAACALLAIAVIVLTGSRMGLAQSAIATLGALWILRGRDLLHLPAEGRARRMAIIAILLAVMIAAAVVSQSEAVHRLRGIDFAADTRAAALPSMIDAARAFMPFGAGLGSFASIYPAFEPDALLSTIYLNQAHNEPLQLAIEGGLPALILLAIFLGWWLWTAAIVLMRHGNVPNRGLARAAVIVTALLMLASLVDYPLRTPLLAALFAFACAEMAFAAKRPRELTSGGTDAS
jgi:O-antigen ligase